VPLIAEALTKLRVKSVTIDGEGVVCRPDGVTDFDRLRVAVGRLGSRDAFLYAFDLLEINGENIRPYEWHVRRATLRSLIKRAGPGIKLSEHLDGDGALAFRHACRIGGHRRQAARPAVSVRAVGRLDQDQELGRAGSD
jgi:bifunctional non-homologous end joining protein LigD